MLDFRLCDLKGRTIGEIEDLPGSQVIIGLSDRRTASVSVSFDDPAAGKVSPLRTVLKARLNDAPVYSGVILRPQFRGRERRASLPSVDPSARLAAFHFGQRADGAAPTGAAGVPYRWTQLDQVEMLRRMISHAQLTTAELASGAPGHGITFGDTPMSGVLRDREYEQGKQVWEAMQQLHSVINGFDFELEPIDTEDGNLVKLNTFYPFQGQDKRSTVEFNYGWGQENLADYTWDRAGDLVKNRSTQVGKKDEDTGAQPSASWTNDESVVKYGLWGEWRGQPEVTLIPTLEEDAYTSVISYGEPINFLDLRPALDDGSGWYRDATNVLRRAQGKFGVAPRFGKNADYYIGDIVSLVIRDGFVSLDIAVRVVGATITRVSNGGVLVEPRVAPVLGGAYRIGGVQPPSLARELEYLRQRMRMVQVLQ